MHSCKVGKGTDGKAHMHAAQYERVRTGREDGLPGQEQARLGGCLPHSPAE